MGFTLLMPSATQSSMRSGGHPPADLFFLSLEGGRNDIVAKVTPGEFMRQVRVEGSKVVWPTRRETVTTAIMVAIMTLTLGVFFFGVDAAFSSIVQFLLSLLSK